MTVVVKCMLKVTCIKYQHMVTLRLKDLTNVSLLNLTNNTVRPNALETHKKGKLVRGRPTLKDVKHFWIVNEINL